MSEYPVNPPAGVLCAENVTVKRIPFANVRDINDASVGEIEELGSSPHCAI